MGGRTVRKVAREPHGPANPVQPRRPSQPDRPGVVRDPPEVEVFELSEAVSGDDLAVAEAILARLLVGHWLSANETISAPPGGG